MSIKNLTTDNTKEDQILNISTVNTKNLGVEFNYLPDGNYSVSDTVTLTAPSGYVHFGGVPSLTPGSAFIVNVNYSPLDPLTDTVLVTGIGSTQNFKLVCSIRVIETDRFEVYFSNLDTSNFIGGQFAFSYLIIKGFS